MGTFSLYIGWYFGRGVGFQNLNQSLVDSLMQRGTLTQDKVCMEPEGARGKRGELKELSGLTYSFGERTTFEFAVKHCMMPEIKRK